MPNVRLAGLVFPSMNATEGIAVELYLSGCAREPKCRGCHNPLLWDFNNGNEIDINDLALLIKTKYHDADSIAIMGGEPLNQHNILQLLQAIRAICPTKIIWLYTSYDLEEISEEYLPYIDFIKTGRYNDTIPTERGDRLASKNQKIWQKTIIEGQHCVELFYSPDGN